MVFTSSLTGEGEAEKEKHGFSPLNAQQELGCGESKRGTNFDKDVVSSGGAGEGVKINNPSIALRAVSVARGEMLGEMISCVRNINSHTRFFVNLVVKKEVMYE